MRIRLIILSLFCIQSLAGQAPVDSIVKHVDSDEFLIQMKLNENYLLLDTRSYKEYRIERIPGAILAEESAKLYRITDTLDLDYPLFIYCSDNIRSVTASELLASMGFKNVYNLKDGLVRWKNYGFILDKRKIKKKEVR
jgi:rhodanese-related sulfurtransferase